MTNEVTQINTLQVWWDNLDFPGKNCCNLHDGGVLVLMKTKAHPERILASLNLENADAAVRALLEKFPEIESRVKELEAEWHATEDKLKLISKVARLREYLLHTNAIGDFDALLQLVNGWEQTITDLIEQNYNTRLALVEKAEQIATESKAWKEDSQKIKDISEEWKSVGYLDKHRNDQLWKRLEEARDKFFERRRQYHEEQEKELLRNLDLKMELVEKAESYASSSNWKTTTEIFKNLMDEWRTVGRTVHEKNDELWNRFILAKTKFYERKKVHFEAIQSEQEKNYQHKLDLVLQAEALQDSTDWSNTTHALSQILEEWKKVGRVPQEKSDELWKRMNAAREVFFGNKRQFLESIRVEQEDNYAQKLALLRRAEEVKNSTNWREVTAEMNELLTEWKKIGRVPKEHLEPLWEQFLAARKHFFKRKDEDRERRKHLVEKHIQYKYNKTKGFLDTLTQELVEEKEKLEDFKKAVKDITPGNKEEELRLHLTKLISATEERIVHKEEKVEDLRKQVQDLLKINRRAEARSKDGKESIEVHDKQ